MENNYQHILTSPERWDNIAFKAYGDPGMVEGIIKANPEVAISAVIPAGTVLNIPVISFDDQAISNEDLPPWMR